MFKSAFLTFVATLILLLPINPNSAHNSVAVPIAPDKSFDSPQFQPNLPVELEYACVVPFLSNYMRLSFGMTQDDFYSVSMVFDPISKELLDTDPSEDVSSGLQDNHSDHNDEFYVDLSAPISYYDSVFVITWSDLDGNVIRQMRFHSEDFQTCDFDF